MDGADSPAYEGHGAQVDEASQRQELQEAQDLYLRTLADFDNYRKRIERERDEIGKAAKRDLLLGLVEIADNFERALGAAAATQEDERSGLASGVTAIYRQVAKLLEANGVTAFESVGEPFDPERHEAVGVVADADAPEDTVVSELRRGYLWNGKLLVPAKVNVAS